MFGIFRLKNVKVKESYAIATTTRTRGEIFGDKVELQADFHGPGKYGKNRSEGTYTGSVSNEWCGSRLGRVRAASGVMKQR